MENPRVSVQIVTRSRNDGLAVLLSSLLRQTYQNFDVVIGENTPDQKIQQHQLCSFICQRLMYEGHRVVVMQIDPNERDIGKLRNALVKNNPFQDSQIFIRVDDDSFCEPDYIELLVKGFKDDSVGIVGGIVPYIHMPLEGRPIPAKFNEVTKFYDWTDNCVFNYNVPRESYFESGHVRSSYAVRMDVAKKLSNLPQRHFVRADDKTIPPFISQNFKQKVGNIKCIEVIEYKGVTHYKGWKERWLEMLDVPVDCEVVG